MTKYHKWKITDGDYVRREEDILIASPENFGKRLKKLVLSLLWKVTLVSLLTFLFFKII